MSAELRQAAIDHLRARFTKAELAEVHPYAGEFNADESTKVGYVTPAVFVAVLGWTPITSSPRLTGKHLRRVHMAAFVATAHAQRDGRAHQALTLAERVALALEIWKPSDTPTTQIASLEEGCRAENLYSRAMDSKKQALWLVSWTQDIKLLVPPSELFDLLAIDIVDHTLRGEVPAPEAPAPGTLIVTEDVKFVQDPQPPAEKEGA